MKEVEGFPKRIVLTPVWVRVFKGVFCQEVYIKGLKERDYVSVSYRLDDPSGKDNKLWDQVFKCLSEEGKIIFYSFAPIPRYLLIELQVLRKEEN